MQGSAFGSGRPEPDFRGAGVGLGLEAIELYLSGLSLVRAENWRAGPGCPNADPCSYELIFENNFFVWAKKFLDLVMIVCFSLMNQTIILLNQIIILVSHEHIHDDLIIFS